MEHPGKGMFGDDRSDLRVTGREINAAAKITDELHRNQDDVQTSGQFLMKTPISRQTGDASA